LPEAEAELVAGYFTEYSSSGFSLFLLAEYGSMILMSVLVHFLLGGWLPLLNICVLFDPRSGLACFKDINFPILFVFVRAALPRYRYDRLMVLGGKFYSYQFSLVSIYTGHVV
jgi:NADH:ubiquinone oxidoreductase subunit H